MQLGVQPHPERGRNPDEIRVASHKNTGNRTVPILSCGGDKQSFTVVLAVKANGEKLPPKAIFKGVRQLRIQVPRGMQVSVHKKGWMEEEGLFFFLYHLEYIIAATTISSNDLYPSLPYFVGARFGICSIVSNVNISSACFLAHSL